jgi:hypothetical protein
MADSVATNNGTIEDAIEARLYGEQEAEEPTEAIEDSEDTQDADQEVEADEALDDSEDDADDADIADILGVPSDQVYMNDDGEIIFNAKVDGQIIPVSIKEMVKSYQLDKHVNNKSMELSAKQKEFEEMSNKTLQEYQSKLETASTVVELLERELYQDIQSADLDQLKMTDPQRYLILRDDLASRVSKLKSVREKLDESSQYEKQMLQNQQAENFHKIVKSEYEKMIAKHPSWANPEVFDKERQSLSTFLKDSYGYNDQEINGIVDHRLIDIIVDARAYRAGQKEVSTKLVKPVPKFQKPGSGKNHQLQKARAIKAKREALRKSGSQADLTSLLLDRI